VGQEKMQVKQTKKERKKESKETMKGKTGVLCSVLFACVLPEDKHARTKTPSHLMSHRKGQERKKKARY